MIFRASYFFRFKFHFVFIIRYSPGYIDYSYTLGRKLTFIHNIHPLIFWLFHTSLFFDLLYVPCSFAPFVFHLKSNIKIMLLLFEYEYSYFRVNIRNLFFIGTIKFIFTESFVAFIYSKSSLNAVYYYNVCVCLGD